MGIADMFKGSSSDLTSGAKGFRGRESHDKTTHCPTEEGCEGLSLAFLWPSPIFFFFFLASVVAKDLSEVTRGSVSPDVKRTMSVNVSVRAFGAETVSGTNCAKVDGALPGTGWFP